MTDDPWLSLSEIDDESVPPPVTDDQISRLFQRYKIDLPSDLLNIYRRQNGGLTRCGECFYSIETDVPNQNIWSLADMELDQGSEAEAVAAKQGALSDLNRVLILCGDGHVWFVLNFNDTASDGEPLMWVVHQDGLCQPTNQTFRTWFDTTCAAYRELQKRFRQRYT